MQKDPPGAAASKKHNISWRAALGYTLLVDRMILHTGIGIFQIVNVAANLKSLKVIGVKPCNAASRPQKAALCYGGSDHCLPKIPVREDHFDVGMLKIVMLAPAVLGSS